jgi:hypothetical protein
MNNGDQCHCQECVLHGERVPPPRRHNCFYVECRNRLIPKAVELTDREVKIVSPKQDNGESRVIWTQTFSKTMDELTAEFEKLAEIKWNGQH